MIQYFQNSICHCIEFTCKAYNGPDTEEADNAHNDACGRFPHGLEKVSLKYLEYIENGKSLSKSIRLYLNRLFPSRNHTHYLLQEAAIE